MKRPELLPIAEARLLVLANVPALRTETVSLEKALSRVLAENIFADRDYPPFNRSAVDGFALSSSDFRNGTSDIAIEGEIMAGLPERAHEPGKAFRIMTGAPVPQGADIVIRVEDSLESASFVRFHLNQVKKWQNIALKGEDLIHGELVLPEKTLLGPTQIASLAATGHSRVKVTRRPQVRIISTGNEIIAPSGFPQTHQIRDSNTFTLLSFLRQNHIAGPTCNLVPDDEDLLRQTLRNAEEDVLIISGGVSMGKADHVPAALEKEGFGKIFHKVAMKPGKPVWFGKRDKQVVFALPGNPISVQVSWKIFAEPFFRSAAGLPPEEPLILPFMSERNKKTSLDEFFPCELRTESLTYLKPVQSNGSGDIRATALSDGIAWHPAESAELVSGDYVKFFRW